LHKEQRTLFVRQCAIDSRCVLLHDQMRMQRVFQFVAFALVLLLTAPAVYAGMACKSPVHHQECSKTCCAGMDSMAMAMGSDARTTEDTPQLSQSACCVVAVTDATLPAALASAPRGESAAMAPVTVVVLAALPMQRTGTDEFPPGLSLQEPTPSRLCTFLI